MERTKTCVAVHFSTGKGLGMQRYELGGIKLAGLEGRRDEISMY